MKKTKGVYSTDDIITSSAEQIHYENENIPYYMMRTWGTAPNTNGVMHWHQDIEVTVVLKGSMKIEIAGKQYTIHQGNGIFINSKAIHGGMSMGSDHICVRLHPILLCTNEYIEENYVTPLLSSKNFSAIPLSHEIPWQKQIMDLITELYMFDSAKAEELPLLIESYFYRIWTLVYMNVKINQRTDKHESIRMTKLKTMMGYIQEHYAEKITLKEIAEAGNVSLGTCNSLFNKIIHRSPVAYLLSYRLNEAQKLLIQTDLSVNEIADRTGISGASYFSEIFHREYELTPREYRRQYAINTMII